MDPKTYARQHAVTEARTEERMFKLFSDSSSKAFLVASAVGENPESALMGAATGTMYANLMRLCGADPEYMAASQASIFGKQSGAPVNPPVMPYDRALFWGLVTVIKVIERDKIEAERARNGSVAPAAIDVAGMAAAMVEKITGSLPEWLREFRAESAEASAEIHRMADGATAPIN